MLLDKFIVLHNEAVDRLGGSGVVAALGVELVQIAVGLENVGKSDFVVNIAPNIVDLDGIKRIDTLKPITVKSEHANIKGGIVGKTALNLKGLNITIRTFNIGAVMTAMLFAFLEAYTLGIISPTSNIKDVTTMTFSTNAATGLTAKLNIILMI